MHEREPHLDHARAIARCLVVYSLLGLVGAHAFAAEALHSILLDTDANPATGCPVTTVKGVVSGVEQVLDTTVTTTTGGAAVGSVSRRVCVAGAFGPSQPLGASGWPVGLGNGVAGKAVIETGMPLSFLGGGRAIRIAVMSTAAGGADAILASAAGSAIVVSPGATVAVSPIPTLHPALVILLALALAVGGVRRARARGVPGLAVAAIALQVLAGAVAAGLVIKDGQIGEWTGIAPLATDAAGNAPANADLLAVHAQYGPDELFFRIDADVVPEAPPANAAPSVDAGQDRSVTLPATAPLAGTAIDDGLPDPPGTLTYAWSVVGGPDLVTFSTPTSLATTASFGVPGVYTLRLTASDSQLSAHDDVQVTANAGANAAPTLGPLADRSIRVGETLAFRVAGDDANEADVLVYEIVDAPPGAGLAPASSPLFTFRPQAAQVGVHPVRLRVRDAAGAAAEASFALTVVPANRPPTLPAQGDAVVPAGGTFSRAIAAGDPDGDPVTLGIVSGPSGLEVVGMALAWRPGLAQVGRHFATVRATDPAGLAADARFAIDVRPASPPLARDDAFEVGLGQTLDVPMPGVLGNDADPNGGALSAHRLTDPDKGSLSAFAADGSFRFVAPAALPAVPSLAPVRKWHGEGGEFAFGYAIGDLDGDGSADVVVQTFNNRLRALRGSDGARLWSFESLPAPYSDCSLLYGDFNAPVIADLDDDGAVEIAFHAGCHRDWPGTGSLGHQRIIAFAGATGSVKWLSPPIIALDPSGGPTAFLEAVTLHVDRLGPSDAPVLLGGFTIEDYALTQACTRVPGATASDRRCRYVFAVDGRDGSLRPGWYAAAPDQSLPRFDYARPGNNGIGRFEPPMAVDLDGDGAREIVYEGTIWRLDGTLVRHLDGTRARPNMSRTAIADLDGDGRVEIIGVELPTGHVRAFAHDGRVLWDTPQFHCMLGVVGLAYCAVSVADVDADGRPEVLVAGGDRLVVLDGAGRIKWTKRFAGSLPAITRPLGCDNRPAVYDLDGDGEPEVMVRVEYALAFLRGRSGEEVARYTYGPATDAYLCEWSLDVRVADVDGDGAAEVVFASTHIGSVLAPHGGIHVLTSDNDPWMRARPLFHEFGYLVTGIEDDLSLPRSHVRHVESAATNLYAQQSQLETRPDLRTREQARFSYEVQAGGVASAPATVTIALRPPNRPPRFTSTPPQGAAPVGFRYQATAVDPDPGETLTFDLVYADNVGALPPAAIDQVTGLLTKANSNPFPHLFVIRVTDSQGASAEQAFAVDFSTQTVAVPDLVGLARGNAMAAITGAGLNAGDIVELFDPAPAGRVLAQTPLPGIALARSAAVDLTVSKGSAPVVVPFVVGNDETVARARLSAAGFGVAVSRRFDPLRPRGEVLAQVPAGGLELPPGEVVVDVSAGTGLELRLASSVVTAGDTMPFTLVATDPAGTPGAPPAATLSVIPLAAEFTGTVPGVAGGALATTAATRGAFRVTATESGGTGRMASAEFVVTNPSSVADFDPMALFAQQGSILEELDARRAALDAAAAAGDASAMRAELDGMIDAWRPLDLRALAFATALAPSGGFPPTPAELLASGVAGHPDDELLPGVLDAVNGLLAALRQELETGSPSTIVLRPLYDALAREAALLESLEPSPLGVLAHRTRYDAIVAHRLPAATNALMLAVADATGAVAPAPTPKARANRPVAKFLTLQEVSSATSIHALLAKKLYLPVVKRIGMSAAFLMARDALRQYANVGEQVALIAGASLSMHVFESQYSAVESFGLDPLDPVSTSVLLIGPSAVAPLGELVEATKEAFKLKVNPDPSKVVKDLKDVYRKLKNLADKASTFAGVIDPENFVADQSLRGCLFDSSPSCSTLVWESGLKSVYTCPGGAFCPPSPVLLFVWSHANGGLSVESPVFMPTFED